jgi:hypothetical protein
MFTPKMISPLPQPYPHSVHSLRKWPIITEKPFSQLFDSSASQLEEGKRKGVNDDGKKKK